MLIEPARQTLARLQGRQNRAARRRGMPRPASGFARAATIWIGLTPITERVIVNLHAVVNACAKNFNMGDHMATNPKALELARKGKVEYEWGTLWPHYHKEKMNWGGGFRTKGDVDILFLSGETGRDPFEDAPCRTPEEERAGKGKVMSHNVKEQTRQCLEYIKNKLEMMDASLKHIVMFRYYLPRREDVFDMRDEMYRFFEEFEPDLREHPRPATLLRGVGIDLKEMLVEIEAWAVVPRKK
jgi:enamine deaminase RidA (YjgF/YER057c/UK114 family)